MPEDRLDKDLKVILVLGVVFKGNVSVGRDMTLDQIKTEHDAVFMAAGAASSRQESPWKAREKARVLWGWEFLRDVALGEDVTRGRKGGGCRRRECGRRCGAYR